MMEKNGRNMGWAFLAITMLIGMALLGLYIPAEADGIDAPTREASFIESVTSEPYYVENGGEDNVTVTIMLNILDSEIDHDNSSMNFYHVDTGETFIEEFPDPVEMEENLTANTTKYVFDIGIPMDTTVGVYNITGTIFNLTGANDTYDMNHLQVNWSERAPMMNNGTIYMTEDTPAVVDLDDHFMDYNMQELMYFINFSAIENLHVEWDDMMENTISVTPAENWNGEQTFELNVTDGIANLTFTITVMVEPAEDPLMEKDDLNLMVNEVENFMVPMEFNPQNWFYDPDGPADFVVSLGINIVNESGNLTEVPAWNWTDGDFYVAINESDNTDGTAWILTDLEMGMAEFPVYAWVDGNITIMTNVTIMVEEVNDVPMLAVDGIDIIWNTAYSGNLSTLFSDAEGDELNFTVNTSMANNVTIDYDWMTFEITITPEVNWTGDSEFEVNVTDGTDYNVVMVPINVMLEKFTISGQVSFEDQEGVMVNYSNVTMMIGDMEVELNETGAYSVELDEGTYSVSLSLVPASIVYDETAMQSGYDLAEMDDIVLSADMTKDINVMWKEYESPVEMATWADLDFDNVKFDEDDDITVIVPILEGSENKTGFGDLVVILVIEESDDEEFNFTLVWNADDMEFQYTLTEEDLEDLGEGKKNYYFTNGTEMTSKEKYEFKSEDDGAGTMTIIILVALIVLVLIALIFIMKKPSDEDFDEDEEEDEEEEGRTCPGCGEAVTDDEAEECPYCGEDLEEE